MFTISYSKTTKEDVKLRLIQRNVRGGAVGSVVELLDNETAEVTMDDGGVMITAEEIPYTVSNPPIEVPPPEPEEPPPEPEEPPLEPEEPPPEEEIPPPEADTTRRKVE